MGCWIIDALGRQTSSLSGQQSKAVETQNRHAEDVAIAQQKIAIENSIPEPSCGPASGSQGPRSGGGGSTAASAGNEPASKKSNVPTRLKKAWDQADPNAPVVPPPDPNVAKVDLGIGSCQGFAGNANSFRGFICRLIEGIKISSNQYADADIKSETLFNGPQEPGKVNNQLTVTAKDKTPERDARQAIIKQLSDPLPPPGITHRAASTPEGAAYIGQLTAYSAKRSMASKPARDWDAMTTADKATLPALNTLLQDPITAKFVTDRLNETFPAWKAEGVSAVELMDLEVEKRIGNPDWLVHMAGATEVEKAAEVPFILAYSQRIAFQQLQETRKMNVLLGQILSMQTEQTMLPELNRLAQQANDRAGRADSEAAR